MVHDTDFWSRWEESESMTEEERETLAKTYHCIYLNQESVRCARLVHRGCLFDKNSSVSRLAAGGVLECVDRVVEDEVEAAWAVVRPPGHHAEVRMRKLVTLFCLQLTYINLLSVRLTRAEASV